MTHTPEPLRSCKNVHPNTDSSPWGWIEATPGATAINAGDPPKGIKQIVWSGYDGQTNAQRLVDCWNACLDMNDPEAEIAKLHQDKAELRQWLGVLLGHVDYTSGACTLTEHVGAVLPHEAIKKARTTLKATQ